MARPGRAEPDAFPIRLDGGAALRVAAAFVAALAVWFAFATPYEKTLAAAAQVAIRAFERPAATRLDAVGGEIRVDRSDFPPDSARPGLPAADLHFNFALLAALFALPPHPLRQANFGRFWLAAVLLWAVHVLALVFQVESVYATRLGPWSAEHYGAVARNFWAAGFHFYQILGRFAAPFVLWWGVGRVGQKPAGK
ncbi:MAG TPA: hypothetical protein VGH97_09255 [Thermoanaerobaculia bacterium]